MEGIEEALNDILPEAFAVVKEACRRNVGKEIVVTGQKMTWNMVPYDVQLIGGIALHQGKATEMATGEGKTLVATMPLYLNALAGRGAHLVTVNTYLAQRDAEWMGVIYGFLGLTVDVIDLYDPGSADAGKPTTPTSPTAPTTSSGSTTSGTTWSTPWSSGSSADTTTSSSMRWTPSSSTKPGRLSSSPVPVGKDTSTPFKQYSALVSNLYRKQTRMANQLVAEAEELLESEEDGDEYQAGEKLLAVKRGTPKHRKLMKMFADEPRLQKLVQRVEADYMREKILHEIDEQLFFAMDEKGHNVHLSDKGIEELSPNDPDAFVIPDLSEAIGAIEEDRNEVPGGEAHGHPGAGGGLCRQEPEDARHPSASEGLHPLPQGRAVHHR